AAGRRLLWGVAHAADLREHVDTIPDAERRRLVENALDRFEQRVAPRWPLLRAQVCHGDFNLDNMLLDGEGRISGVTDFGDIAFTAQAADFAIGLASLLRGRPAGDVFRAARIATDGYQSRIPLEPLELELLGDLVAARLAAIVTISAWRAERYPADGRRLLDAYNNVPVVGHCHPRVTEAVVRQTRLVNTHARYLYEPLIELAERLVALMPAGYGLDTVMLVNSGSEANELAWRFATAATGGEGAIVTEHAYHGVTTTIADLSPEEWPAGYEPTWVARIAPPREGVSLRAEMQSALERLPVRPAATFLDTAFTS